MSNPSVPKAGKCFFIGLTALTLALAITLAYAVFVTPVTPADREDTSPAVTGQYAATISNGSSGYIWIGMPNNSEVSSYNKTQTSNGSFGYVWIGTFYYPEWSSYNKTPKTNELPSLEIFNKTSWQPPEQRKAVIVYFSEMPVSLDDFVASYGITPIFVKADIRMAAFESEVYRYPDPSSNKTAEVIGKLSADYRVEQAFRDTYMFLDIAREINMSPTVTYPEDYERTGAEFVPEQVIVGFWRLPPSLEEFGDRYGGKPVIQGEYGLLSINAVLFETDDIDGFIDRVSRDPYVRYVEPNAISYITADVTIDSH